MYQYALSRHTITIPRPLFTLNALLGRRLVIEIELAAVGEDDFCSGIAGSYICDGLAVPGRTQNNRDFIAGFDGAFRPARTRVDAGAACFDAPMNDVAVLVFDVQIDL